MEYIKVKKHLKTNKKLCQNTQYLINWNYFKQNNKYIYCEKFQKNSIHIVKHRNTITINFYGQV